jgi:hypothetical protein
VSAILAGDGATLTTASRAILSGTQKGDPVKLLTLLLSSTLAVLGCGGTSPSRDTGGATSSGAGGATTTRGASSSGAGGATTIASSTSSGAGGAVPDGGQDFCAQFCATTLLCGMQDKCTLADPAAAASGCSSACLNASKALTPAEVGTLAACFACLNAQTPALCPGVSFGPCKSVCDDTAVNQAANPFFNALQQAPGTAALACTDGENLLLSHCAEGSSASSCTLSCSNSTTSTSPDVAAQCTVPDAGPIPCTCTAGKNKGKTFSVPSTPEFCGSIEVWVECNL